MSLSSAICPDIGMPSMCWAYVTDLIQPTYRGANRLIPVKVATHRCKAVIIAMDSTVAPMAVTANPRTDTVAAYAQTFCVILIAYEGELTNGSPVQGADLMVYYIYLR